LGVAIFCGWFGVILGAALPNHVTPAAIHSGYGKMGMMMDKEEWKTTACRHVRSGYERAHPDAGHDWSKKAASPRPHGEGREEK